MLIEFDEPVPFYSKQWKRVIEITHINEHQQLLDSNGVYFAPDSLREIKATDLPKFYQLESAAGLAGD